MELACLAPAPSEAAQFCEVLPVDYVDGVIEEIGDVHAALLRVGREVHGTRRAANGLRSNVDLAHKTTFAYLAIRIGAGVSDLGCLEDLYAIVAAIADIEQA